MASNPPALSTAMWDALAQHMREAGLVPEEIMVPRPNCIEAVTIDGGLPVSGHLVLEKLPRIEAEDGD